MNPAAALRQEIAALAEKFAVSHQHRHALSYSELPAVCFVPNGNEQSHGNFTAASYKAILSNPAWRKRLAKVHTLAGRSLPPSENGRWRELDSCMSSDALLMNIFCHPRALRDGKALALLGVDSPATPRFGYKPRVPLREGKFDRTEVDMLLGNLLVEAKLTESGFQRAEKRVLSAYRDFDDVFDTEQLLQTESHYISYQLLRNVLAAHAQQRSFCVLLDARRPDLTEAWFAVIRCVKSVGLRAALKVLTWQELAQALPCTLQAFLAAKYGIAHD